jgi:hypothetical protein
MKCQICPRYRVCAGVTSQEVKPIDMVRLHDLFFHEINMTDSVLSFV